MSDIKTYSIEDLASHRGSVCLEDDVNNLLDELEGRVEALEEEKEGLNREVSDLNDETATSYNKGYNDGDKESEFKEFLNDVFVPLRNDDIQEIKVKLVAAIYEYIGRIV